MPSIVGVAILKGLPSIVIGYSKTSNPSSSTILVIYYCIRYLVEAVSQVLDCRQVRFSARTGFMSSRGTLERRPRPPVEGITPEPLGIVLVFKLRYH